MASEGVDMRTLAEEGLNGFLDGETPFYKNTLEEELEFLEGILKDSGSLIDCMRSSYTRLGIIDPNRDLTYTGDFIGSALRLAEEDMKLPTIKSYMKNLFGSDYALAVLTGNSGHFMKEVYPLIKEHGLEDTFKEAGLSVGTPYDLGGIQEAKMELNGIEFIALYSVGE